MKKIYKILFFVIFTLALILTSCRNEELELIQPDTEEVLAPNSTAATLIQRTSMKDGSNDNIIDGASCLEVKLPVTVVANGLEITIINEDGFDTIEDIFDALEDDEDIIEFLFPITIILSDHTEVTVNSLDAFEELLERCEDENEEDEDIECIDFKYPFRISVFNTNNEVIETVVIESDRQLYRFVERIENNDVVRINFPISLILSDGTEVVINNLDELERAIEAAIDDCDEDDDNDYDDDDCEDCTNERFNNFITGCEKWEVSKLIKSNTNQTEQYLDFLFSFSEDGRVTVYTNGNTLSGTWESGGEGNNISFVLNIPDLPDFNNTWRVREIEEDDEDFEIYLVNGEDKLNFESTCGEEEEEDPNEFLEILKECDWEIAEFKVNGQSQLAEFQGYELSFEEGGTLLATVNDGITQGSWELIPATEQLFIGFSNAPVDDLTDEWFIFSVTEDRIELRRDLQNDTDILVLESLCDEEENFDGLAEILQAQHWKITEFETPNQSLAAEYEGYKIVFEEGGTVFALLDNEIVEGGWNIGSNDNTILAIFFQEAPFDDLTDEWEVVEVSETYIELHGSNGRGTVLVLEKFE